MWIHSVLILSCALGTDPDLPDGITPEKLLDTAYTVASRLKSIDYTMSIEESGVGPRSMRIRERENRVRGDAFFGLAVPDATGDYVRIFDGAKHTGYTLRTRELWSNVNATETFALTFDDPLCATYRWVMTLPMISSLQRKSRSKFMEKASHADLLTASTVNGVNCQRVRIAGPNETWVILEIADETGIPMRWAEFSNSTYSDQEVTVQRWRAYPTDEGLAILPTSVDVIWRLLNRTGKVVERKETYTVDMATVLINPTLGEDVFTIPYSGAKQIFDGETQELLIPDEGVVHKVNSDGSLQRNIRRVPGTPFFQSWIVTGGLLAAAFAGLVAWFYVTRGGSP